MSDVPDDVAKKIFEWFANGPEHPVISDLLNRLSAYDDAAFVSISVGSLRREETTVADLAARLARAEKALEEAEKVISPFANIAPVFDATIKPAPQRDGDTVHAWETMDLGYLEITVGHLRAARAWMEKRNG